MPIYIYIYKFYGYFNSMDIVCDLYGERLYQILQQSSNRLQMNQPIIRKQMV